MTHPELTLLRAPAPFSGNSILSPKTMAPRQGEKILPRQHLFAKIDRLLDSGHLWINGPPGSGKTMLAAGYSTHSGIPVAWYTFDPLDADLVSFFTTLPLSFSPCAPPSPTQSPLPVLLPEDMQALPIFARKFFRKLFARLPAQCLLVLDNIQEIPDDSPLADLLVICLQELPVTCRAIFLSRKPPPPVFSRQQINGSLLMIEPDMLRFTRDEISKVVARHGIMEEQERCIEYLDRTTAGWAAGLTLLLNEQNREICVVGNRKNDLAHQQLFDYFTGVIFSGFREHEQNILMLSSLLPEVRPDVIDRLTGRDTSREYFLRLSRDNFFTYRMDRQGTLFQFHPLFKEFLQHKAYTTLPEDTRISILEQAAVVFIAENRLVEGVDLLIMTENWPRCTLLIQQTGTTLVEQGRFKTLLRWQQAIPDTIISRDPWLLLFFGNATTAFAPTEAIEILKKSFVLFEKQGNTAGALLACSSLTNSIINHLSDLSLLDPWLDFLEEKLEPHTFPDDGSFTNVSLANAIFRALVLRRPAHPDLEDWLQVVVRQGGMHPALITHYLWTGRFTEARSALDRIYVHRERIGSKLQLSAIKAMEVQYYLIMARADRCREIIDDALQMIEETGIRVWEVHFLILGAGCCLNCGEHDQAARYLRAVEKKMGQARLLERSYYHVVRTLEALLADDLIAADRHQQSALDMAATIGMPSYDTWCWYGSALVAVFQNNCSEAQRRFAMVFAGATAPGNPWFTCQAHFGMAFMFLGQNNRQKMRYHLEKGFTLARRKNYLTFFFFLPKMMEPLAVAALEEGIETTFIQRLVRHWRLVPCHPPVHLADWPWPLKIFTLGRFAILRNGEKLDRKTLAKNRPVQLLLTIIALGGRQVNKLRLADIFWPDADGDEQAAALKTTLHRLRNLLEVKDAVIQTRSSLSLNPRVCWVDCWQFERLAGEALSERPDDGKQTSAAGKALISYQGTFLEEYRDEPWSFPYRQRLEQIYNRLLAYAPST